MPSMTAMWNRSVSPKNRDKISKEWKPLLNRKRYWCVCRFDENNEVEYLKSSNGMIRQRTALDGALAVIAKS